MIRFVSALPFLAFAAVGVGAAIEAAVHASHRDREPLLAGLWEIQARDRRSKRVTRRNGWIRAALASVALQCASGGSSVRAWRLTGGTQPCMLLNAVPEEVPHGGIYNILL